MALCLRETPALAARGAFLPPTPQSSPSICWPGDVLVALRDIRVYDTAMVSTVLALTEGGMEAEVAWGRGRELRSGSATF